MQRPKRRVAVLIETGESFGREIIRGIVDWARSHANWQISIDPGDPTRAQMLPGWSGDGIICRPNGRTAKTLTESIGTSLVTIGQPIPGRRGKQQSLSFWQNPNIATFAWKYLRSLGHRNFAFFSHPVKGDFGRSEHFIRAIGHSIPTWIPDESGTHLANALEWLSSLPKPCAIWAANDAAGFLLLELCRTIELSVPKDVAILGCDNDKFLCDLASPALSSISLPTYELGLASAATLDAMMEVRSLPRQPIPLLRLVVRASTDWSASADPLVAAAAVRMSGKEHEKKIQDMAFRLGVSTRSLQRHTKKSTGMSPSQLRRENQFHEAQHLLATTDLSISAIADQVGYSRTAVLADAFRRRYGISPRAWRKTHSEDDL